MERIRVTLFRCFFSIRLVITGFSTSRQRFWTGYHGSFRPNNRLGDTDQTARFSRLVIRCCGILTSGTYFWRLPEDSLDSRWKVFSSIPLLQRKTNTSWASNSKAYWTFNRILGILGIISRISHVESGQNLYVVLGYSSGIGTGWPDSRYSRARCSRRQRC